MSIKAGKKNVSSIVGDTLQGARALHHSYSWHQRWPRWGVQGRHRNIGDDYSFPVWLSPRGPFVSSSVLFHMVDVL